MNNLSTALIFSKNQMNHQIGMSFSNTQPLVGHNVITSGTRHDLFKGLEELIA